MTIKFKKSKVIILSILVLVGSSSILSACSPNIDPKCQKSIAMVLSSMFTCPNTDLLAFLEEPVEIVPDSKNPNIAIPRESENYKKYIDTNYAPYLTEEALARFRQSMNDIQYHRLASDNGYTISVKSIEAIQQKDKSVNYSDKNRPTITYEFTATLLYGKKDAEQNEYKMSGSAYCNPDGIISYLRFYDDGGLIKNIMPQQ